MDKKEYIERREVYSEINKLPLTEDAAMEILWAVDKIPTADVRPERHGCWIEDESGVIICSECGEEHEQEDYRSIYCEYCGAKMDLDNDTE